MELRQRAGRFHGANILGLVVGAMGLAVFTSYLRTWARGPMAAA